MSKMRLTLTEWVAERLANCLRIAETKDAADREGWFEDADYFRHILTALSPLGLETEPDEQPLEVGVIGGRLSISIGVKALAFAVTEGTGVEGHMRITDPLVAAMEIAAVLHQEEEDGTTEVHKLLDRAAFSAWENGAEGFAE